MNFKEYVLGIELGSTRIKAVLIDKNFKPVAEGGYDWENHYVDGVWTYPLDEVETGLKACYKNLTEDIEAKFGEIPDTYGAIGISGMMHGYLPFDKDKKQLSMFRTWRNTMTKDAAEKLSALFNFSVPQRWSIAHLYREILLNEAYVKDIAYLTTLAGYIHWMLTGQQVMGIGEASGMFPIDSDTFDYDQKMVDAFDKLHNNPWKLRDILPKVLVAGDDAGELTAEGAAFLDPTGVLKPCIPMAPPEGDAGTGMVATNSVRKRTGNVSAGTSDFAMIVLERPLGVHKEINMVTTPSGAPTAMAHCSNCTSDINAWASVFEEFAEKIGASIDKNKLFTTLFSVAAEGDTDCGGLLSYNYYSGEGITEVDDGRPLFIRKADSDFTLANFMRMHLMSALATLKLGIDILTKRENVEIDVLYGHGGYFKTPGIGQRILSAATGAPVSVMETAGEGGPYGMALLAAYKLYRREDEPLEDFLDNKVYANAKVVSVMADAEEIEGFNKFLSRFKDSFELEKTAIELFK